MSTLSNDGGGGGVDSVDSVDSVDIICDGVEIRSQEINGRIDARSSIMSVVVFYKYDAEISANS